ncbi:MAG: hypothetical protein IKF18_07110 [Erysipelotrichaceae bacterium]|nr:hypothetical protein [Erysipelotrichaceae bacterium]MCR5299751.1 hypothetical protein [Erysipelotrichaceae bacterium]
MVDSTTFTVNSTNLTMRIQQAEMYLKEFENEIKRAQGATGIFRSREDALSRIKILNEFAPDDPRVKDLFQRARNCVIGSTGNFTEITGAMTQYLVNEENIRRLYCEKSENGWKELTAEYADKTLEKIYPAPDPMNDSMDEVTGKYVILDEVRYPMNQFMGVTGEFIYVGKRSTGMYFVKIDSRKWLGPYEAVKRYRRLVDSTMMEVDTWTILGEITDVTMEIPEAGQKKIGGPVYAVVVEPVALYVPGHVLGLYDPERENSGRFLGEEEVAGIKESWYTEKSVPEDVTPERLVEIFRQAIKEKNYDLYVDCIQPERRQNPTQESLLLYHWDLHQERFHGEYVHAEVVPDATKITVVKGYNDEKGLDSYFLSSEDQQKIAERYGEKVEYASVQTIAFDKNGKQLGSPVRRNLIRTNGGRWYVRDYEIRF